MLQMRLGILTCQSVASHGVGAQCVPTTPSALHMCIMTYQEEELLVCPIHRHTLHVCMGCLWPDLYQIYGNDMLDGKSSLLAVYFIATTYMVCLAYLFQRVCVLFFFRNLSGCYSWETLIDNSKSCSTQPVPVLHIFTRSS